MNSVVMKVKGEMLAQDGINSLTVQDLNPASEANNLIFLRFAFITRGKGGNIFPSFILDDWGREIRGLKLYDWVRQNGEQFPRGEIFGYEEDGQETQCFLRELELYAKLPTYAFKDKEQPLNKGSLIHAVLLPLDSILAPIWISPPQAIKSPLRSALVNWWQVPFGLRIEDYKLLNTRPDPGY